jgi:spore coat protein U-like protein
MIKNKTKKTLLVFSMLLLGSSYNAFTMPAGAVTGSGSISATGSVAGTCSVTASAMSFGALNDAGDITKTSTVSPTCTSGTTWTVTNAGNTNNLYYNNEVSATAANIIAFPIVLTGGSVAFTLDGAASGKLTGTGTGSAQDASPTLTGTAGSSTGKTPGNYAGLVMLTITY